MTDTAPAGRVLDRVYEEDWHSLDYPTRLTAEQRAAPRSAMWACDYYLDQGAEGACVGFGCAHEAGADPVIVPVSNDYARGVYHECQAIDGFPDDQPGTSVLAGAKVMTRRGFWTGYRWCLTMDDLVATVGHLGPVVMGCNWYEGMYRPDSAGFLRPTGGIVGGHCVLVVGVNVEQSHFTIHNSWGKGWGQNARAKIAYADMARLMGENGDFCVPEGRTVPGQPQPEEDDMGPGICYDSKGRRWVFGRGGDKAVWATVDKAAPFSIGGIATSGVAAVAAKGGVEVAIRGQDNAMWVKRRNDADPFQVWAGWEKLGGIYSAPRPGLARRLIARLVRA